MTHESNAATLPQQGDALVLVDVQNDFLPGGSLAVPEGDRVIPALNHVIEAFRSRNLPVFATRDWHPSNHCSFREHGGTWPPHCVSDTGGAELSPDLRLPPHAEVVSKAITPEADSYSGFGGTDLHDRLQSVGTQRLFVGGLATDYCVLNTVKDALDLGYDVILLRDGIRAVNVNPGDGEKAEQEMIERGAVPIKGETLPVGKESEA